MKKETVIYDDEDQFGEEVCDEAVPKSVLLDRLKAFGVKKVVVRYHGYSGSGGVFEIKVTDPDGQKRLIFDAYQNAYWNCGNDPSTAPVYSDLERLALDIVNFCMYELDHNVIGWDIGEGSDGTFTFDVESGVTCSHDQGFRKSDIETWEV